MPFPAHTRTINEVSAMVDNIAEIKKTALAAKSDFSDNRFSSDALISLIQQFKKNAVALEQIKTTLNLVTGPSGSFVGDFNAVLLEVNSFLTKIQQNIPMSNGFLLLHKLDANLNVEPRVFSGPVLTTLSTQLDKILQEIS